MTPEQIKELSAQQTLIEMVQSENESVDELCEAPDMNKRTLGILKNQRAEVKRYIAMTRDPASIKKAKAQLEEIEEKIRLMDVAMKRKIKPMKGTDYKSLENNIKDMLANGITPHQVLDQFDLTVKKELIYDIFKKLGLDAKQIGQERVKNKFVNYIKPGRNKGSFKGKAGIDPTK